MLNLLWQQWILIGLALVDLTCVILLIGVQRKPISRGDAAFKLIATIALIWMIVSITN